MYVILGIWLGLLLGEAKGKPHCHRQRGRVAAGVGIPRSIYHRWSFSTIGAVDEQPSSKKPAVVNSFLCDANYT